MCGAPSKRPELSSSRKTVEDLAFVFGSRSKRTKLMKWTEPSHCGQRSDVSTWVADGYFARDVSRAAVHAMKKALKKGGGIQFIGKNGAGPDSGSAQSALTRHFERR